MRNLRKINSKIFEILVFVFFPFSLKRLRNLSLKELRQHETVTVTLNQSIKSLSLLYTCDNVHTIVILNKLITLVKEIYLIFTDALSIVVIVVVTVDGRVRCG